MTLLKFILDFSSNHFYSLKEIKGFPLTMNTKKHLFFVFALLTMILVACKPETDVKHTVTYKDSQLKTLDTHIVQSGNTDIPPATNEEKEGLDFIGWSLDENGEKLFDFNTPITSDITLYPIWEVNALYNPNHSK